MGTSPCYSARSPMKTCTPTAEHIAKFLSLLKVLGERITFDLPEISSALDGLTIQSGRTVYFSACAAHIAAMYRPASPVVFLIAGPHPLFDEELALAFFFIEEGGLLYGALQLPSGRRLLALRDKAVLDSAGKTTGIDPDAEIVPEGTPMLVRILLRHMVETFPPLDARGEDVRRQILAQIHA